MNNYLKIMLLLIGLSFFGCNSAIKEDELVGTWKNEKDNCKIQFNKDLTFNSTNIPLDVVNKNFVNKQTKEWKGAWSVKGSQIRLSKDDYYYYLNITHSFFSSKVQLHVTLLDEVGGEMIFLEKKE